MQGGNAARQSINPHLAPACRHPLSRWCRWAAVARSAPGSRAAAAATQVENGPGKGYSCPNEQHTSNRGPNAPPETAESALHGEPEAVPGWLTWRERSVWG